MSSAVAEARSGAIKYRRDEAVAEVDDVAAKERCRRP